MDRQTFAWGRSKKKIRGADRWVERLWVLGLFLAAILLFGINLGVLPLRDWDEGTVAQVAREIWQAKFDSLRWLYPTLGGTEYFNKPPLMHLLIAGAYAIGGVNEWTTRLPGALLSAACVPLLYGIGRELFRRRLPALFSALIYLTLLPVVRHGRLAMLDGAVLCFFLFMMWCVLRSRRNLRYALGAGIGFGLICLTKGMMGLLLLNIALVFLAWDTPRLLTSLYFWIGLLLGSVPVAAWYGAQFLHYGQAFVNTGIFSQSLQRIWAPVENHAGPPWYYLLEILKYGWPWLFLLPQGLRLAWENRNMSWAKLVLVWMSVYLVAISVMGTKLPWYVLPIYPAVALLGGAQLAEIWNAPSKKSYPRSWVPLLTVMGLAALSGSFYFAAFGPQPNWNLQLVFASAALTLLITAVLIYQKDLQFIPLLFWGTYVTLLLLMTSPHWNWELAEAYPVKPVAAMIKRKTPINKPIYTSYDHGRPSLNFYSDRQVIPATDAELQQRWKGDAQPYFLLDQPTFKQLNLKPVKAINQAEGWLLITKPTAVKPAKSQKPQIKD
ncbi:glycosyltransferase family 39 protein [Coleofasciculus sp. FACHB-64]|uniref:ArnT family glycosyltransferase n=1 Tax=Cyanophyceae TaxID=3028117 RepID=UPI0016832316|nr:MULTISPECIES: glycosyltransferase family 39 protein [unclassified Coleofasciculus]MBD1837270.1 glycosyltransferase family 39 protein [Coleofasciculus sp. FACHB-501]MBD1882375.1 glycosyltransferase family 39 protein [Coleofasciculus sp. FACHB-T130]MBD2044846.1 glycosyltransferase family 39 protein [Coleofasciculus sp. FACHB-64]MBD2086033.1 glycosyltransferase family 39 protein [Coleofasciculus sp. FACHB-542]